MPISGRQIFLHLVCVSAPTVEDRQQRNQPMEDRVERRVEERDPIDVLTPEVFALLKLCGGLRATDVEPKSERRQRGTQSSDRRGADRRSPEMETR